MLGLPHRADLQKQTLASRFRKPVRLREIFTPEASIQNPGRSVYDPSNGWGGDGIDLQLIRNATLVLHVRIAIATAIKFLSQMAILRCGPPSSHMSARFVEKGLHCKSIDAHAKDDQRRLSPDGQRDKYLPRGLQSMLFIKKLAHNFKDNP